MAKRRWLPIVAGVVILLGFLVVGIIVAVTAWFSQNLQVRTEVAASDADSEFETIRRKFAGRLPLLELRDGVPRYSGGKPPAALEAGPTKGDSPRLQSVNILIWDPDEKELARFSLPFWLLRMKSEPIRLSSYASGMDDSGVNLRPEDIEKVGPGIILDTATESGERILLWAQ